MKRFFNRNVLLILIVLIASFVRLYQLGNIPASLNHDETALGYNAYAILKTGADEHGAYLPLSLKSFGDWKLPLYPVVSIPLIALFNLTEISVRLPSALAGVIGVILVFLISNQLFKQKEIGLFAALFYALSPWNIYFSRMAYEANLATTFFLGGLFCFLKFLENKNGRILILGAILFGLTLFTYHAFVIFTPLFFLSIIFLFRDSFFSKKEGFVSVGIIIIILGISFFSSIQGSVGKLSDFSIIGDKDVIYNRAEQIRNDNSSEPSALKQLLFNKYSAVFYQISQNYIESFSPSFLFDKGGEKLLHTLGVFGNLYLFDVLLLIVGLIFLLWKREKASIVLALWLIIGPLPSAITKDAPSSTRLVMILPALMIVAGYGAYTIVNFLRIHRLFRYAIVVLVTIYLLNVVYFIDLYFYHIDTLRGRYLHFGFKQIVELSQKYPDKKIVVKGPDNFPYISFLFYTRYDPRAFRREVTYYPRTDSFEYVKSFGKYSFVKAIDFSHLKPNTLYITDQISGNPTTVIKLPSGEPIFYYQIVQ